MACVTNVKYVFVVNGYPSDFFGAGRGLRQGCSLSPLLFILLMDNLGLHIKEVVAEGHFDALHIGRHTSICQGFFCG